MITRTYQPQTLSEALHLMRQPHIKPLGGGTWLRGQKNRDFAAIDLSALPLNQISQHGTQLHLGATLTLQALLEADSVPGALKKALLAESPRKIRLQATLGGRISIGGGRSPLLTMLLGLDASIKLAALNDEEQVAYITLPLGDFLPLRAENLAQRLITQISLPATPQTCFARHTVKGKNALILALARWPSGRTRAAVGGWGRIPTLAMDGQDAAAVPLAVRNVCHEANDALLTAQERMTLAAALSQHCLTEQEI